MKNEYIKFADTRRAFTLIELLVVISIIALLIAILLPALTRARQAARTGMCMSQGHQLAVANEQYASDNDDMMPIQLPQRGASSYTHGGRTPINGGVSTSWAPLCWNRPLNSYAHPELPLGKGESLDTLKDPNQYNFPIFQCPSDSTYSYQLGQDDDGNPGTAMSNYHAIGTSYTFNLTWGDFRGEYTEIFDAIHVEVGGDEGDKAMSRANKLFAKARLEMPSQFVAFFDDPADYAFWYRISPKLTHHGTRDRHTFIYLDGHTIQAETDVDDVFNSKYMLVFPSLMK
ncbi:MAG: DUF1559 domain-containing protein [Planctomycetes bacterium]|nr:DUF1559 domain-containing protein [Planctomycetota bacterium]NOG54389.1 DUF1559 domain-containing protein [Planctomycetota bacterium]